MGITLYRKYRPQTFGELIGQKHIKEILQNEIKAGKTAHAYLFCGPRGTGKTTTARLLAKAVNCLSPKDGEPCNECDMCQVISKGQSLDLIEIDAASNRGINEIRELRDQVRFAPSKAKFKVFIIDEVHMLTTEAFNALLKTLEEPPRHALFILATTEIHKVPETIISRCQRFDFSKIAAADLVARMERILEAEGVEVEKEILAAIAWRSEGCSRDAEGLLGQVLALGGSKITTDQASLVLPRSNVDSVAGLAGALLDKDARAALNRIGKLAEEGVDIKIFTHDLIEFLRRLMVCKIAGNFSQMRDVGEDRAKDLSGKVPIPRLAGMISFLVEQSRAGGYAQMPQLPLELASARICLGGEEPAVHSSAGGGEEPAASSVSRKTGKKEKEVSVPSAKMKEGGAVSKSKRKKPDIESLEAEKRPEALVKAEGQLAGKSYECKTTLAEVEKQWGQIVRRAKEVNRSLYGLLQGARPVSLDKGVLTLGFGYKFHQDRLKDRNNKRPIEEILEKIFKENIVLESTLINPSLIRRKSSVAKTAGDGDRERKAPVFRVDSGEENMLNTVLEAFGGEIVG